MSRLSRTLNNEQGSSLILALATAAIIGIVSLLFASMFKASHQEMQRLNSHVSAVIARTNLQTILENDLAWANTLAANASLSCVRSVTDCSAFAAAPNPIPVIKNSVDVTVFDSSVPTHGFSPDGSSCDSFNSTASNPVCPFRIRLTWKPICPPLGPCIGPQIEINGEFEVGSNIGFPFNPSQFPVKVLR